MSDKTITLFYYIKIFLFNIGKGYLSLLGNDNLKFLLLNISKISYIINDNILYKEQQIYTNMEP